MAKFEPGQEVVRINAEYHDMAIGDTDRVVWCGSRLVELHKFGNGHEPCNLELVHSTPAELCPPTTIAEQRKATPVYSGVLRYFPDALQAVAQCSKAGNDQHNPGEPLHWAREKSGDELDALTRHLLDAGSIDTDGVRHSTKVAWRALANLQKELEQAGESDATSTD